MIKKLVRIYGGHRLNLTRDITRELEITDETVMQLTVEDGVITLEPVEVKTIVKPRKKKKVDQHAEK